MHYIHIKHKKTFIFLYYLDFFKKTEIKFKIRVNSLMRNSSKNIYSITNILYTFGKTSSRIYQNIYKILFLIA